MGQITLDAVNVLKASEYKIKELKEINTYQNMDVHEGFLVRFTAESTSDGSVMEAETLVKPRGLWSTTGMPPRTISLAVGTEYDPKEILFKNRIGVMGHTSDPVVLVQAGKNEQRVLFDVAFFNPAGDIATVEQLPLEAGKPYPDETVQPTLPKPLMPGKWTVAMVERGFDDALFTQEFLVLPIVQESGMQGEYPAVPKDWVLSDLHRHLVAPNLKAQAEANNRKYGAELFAWAKQLAGEFYTVRKSCISSGTEIGELWWPVCQETTWSSLSSDPKSEVGDVNPATGRIIG